MDSIITVVSGADSSIFAYPIQLFDDLKLLIAVVIGVPLAFWVIKKIVSLIRSRG